MNWQNANDILEDKEENKTSTNLNTQQNHLTTIEELEENKALQLEKNQDPALSIERQAYMSLVNQFGSLLISNNIDEIRKTLLTDDCQFFLFSCANRPPVLYSLTPDGLHNLYKGIRIQEKRVSETYVDLEKTTIIQFSHQKILYADEEAPVDEIVAELFTVKQNKISKYRASFARSTPAHGDRDPFEPSRKDKILAKIKEINYALADQPDFNKVASYFTENTQYKVWSWETQKCFTLTKHDFVERFRDLEENLTIKCVVPYEVFTESQFGLGTYVYHLEGKSGKYAGKNYIWANTCLYSFDENLNIIKISQQGELHIEGEVKLLFEVYSRSRIEQIASILTKYGKSGQDLFYDGIIQFACPIYRYAPQGLPAVGFFEGLTRSNKQVINEAGETSIEWNRIAEIYVDSNASGYDVAIEIICDQGMLNFPNYKYKGRKMNFIQILSLSLEKGKIGKGIAMYLQIPEQIPSPFNDITIKGINITPRDMES